MAALEKTVEAILRHIEMKMVEWAGLRQLTPREVEELRNDIRQIITETEWQAGVTSMPTEEALCGIFGPPRLRGGESEAIMRHLREGL